MNGLRLAFLAAVGITVLLGGPQTADAQIYGGIGFGPRHHYSGFYAGGYRSGAYGYYGPPYLTYAPGYVGSYGYSSFYGIGSPGYGTSYGLGAYNPVIVAPNPVYGTTTTIIRGGPTGGVIQYSNNGNGYTYAPDSSYPTVIQQQPTLGLSRTYLPPSPPPVVIESRPPGSTYGLSNSITSPSGPSRPAGTIKLVCPKTAGGPLTYALNGLVYTIQPGYSQTFRDDRAWTLEFKRGGEGSEVARYALKAGVYNFAVGASGWELQQPGNAPNVDLPPAPLPEVTPPPPLSAIPGPPPTPLPPP
jgi:hypothetical protein